MNLDLRARKFSRVSQGQTDISVVRGEDLRLSYREPEVTSGSIGGRMLTHLPKAAKGAHTGGSKGVMLCRHDSLLGPVAADIYGGTQHLQSGG